MDCQQYRLRWNNHRTNMLNVFGQLLTDEMYTDVTLAVDDGQTIKCHKIVLAACSSYFQELFRDHQPCEHMIVVLKDVGYFDIKSILQYMYSGEVNVGQNQLSSLLKVAEVLRVKGLVEEHRTDGGNERERMTHDDYRNREMMETSMSPPPAISTSTGSIPVVHSSGHPSPPHSTGGAYDLYGKSSMAGAVDHGQNHLAASGSLWMHPSISAGHQPTPHSSPVAAALGSSYDNGSSYNNGFEPPCKRARNIIQPSMQSMNRDTPSMPILRTVLGRAHADSSQSIPLLQPDSHESMHFHGSSNGAGSDKDSHRSSVDLAHGEIAHSSFKDMLYDDKKRLSPLQYPRETNKTGVTNHSSRTPNWKRYKQYTREDILAAIESVRSGTSAVQAARKYKVPSRTLYDKVKKLGIPTSRPFKRSANGKKAVGYTFCPNLHLDLNGALRSNDSIMSGGENKNSRLENVARSTVFQTFDNSTKDMPRDHDSVLDPTAGCSSSPEERCSNQDQQEDEENQVEDLSVSRKSDVPVIVPPVVIPSVAIKDETQETEPDNNDCCDHN